MRVLVLGGYGLIGREIARAGLEAGHKVTGLGRSAARGRSVLPEIEWIGADIARLTTPADWVPYLRDVDAVVNAAGALQDGLLDRVARVQRDAVLALIRACERAGIRRFIQISAPGVSPEASTLFYRTKAAADAGLKASGLDWTIFRPGLVLSPTAYGGTALVRMLAGFPVIQPIALADTCIQTVPVRTVGQAVVAALSGHFIRTEIDLVEDAPHRLGEIVAAFRAWLGFRPARAQWPVPGFLAFALATAGDAAGWLGWRPALRSTAFRVLREGVRGDPAPWRDAMGAPVPALVQSLRTMPATAQERLYARAQLLFPVLVLTLSAFWIASGAIGLWRRDVAAGILDGVFPEPLALALVVAGGCVDLAIGAAILFRPALRLACGAAILVSLAYLALGTVFMPHLWADPLGPFVKIFPGLALALACAGLAEGR